MSTAMDSTASMKAINATTLKAHEILEYVELEIDCVGIDEYDADKAVAVIERKLNELINKTKKEARKEEQSRILRILGRYMQKHYDLITEVMDVITGFCSTHQKESLYGDSEKTSS